MMKNKYVEYYNESWMITFTTVIGIIVGALVVSLTWWITSESEVESEPTCEYMQKSNWAFQQCLKFQPACQMPKGHEQFMQYHDFQTALVKRCESKPGDFLPD